VATGVAEIGGKLYRIVLFILLAAAVVQSGQLAWVRMWGPFAPSRVEIGDVLEIAVKDDSGRRTDLSSVALGGCGLIVISSRSCTYCRQLIDQWRVTLNTLRPGPPQDWTLTWVLVERDHQGFFEESDRFYRFTSVRPGEILKRTNLRGTPSFISLDRDGRISGMGLGPVFLSDLFSSRGCTVEK